MKPPSAGLLFLRQRYPLGGVLIAAVAGILLASELGSSWGLFCLLSVAVIVGLFCCRQGGVLLAITTAVFALLQLWSWNEAPAKRLAAWFDDNHQVFEVQGIITSEPKISPSGMAAFSLRLENMIPLDGDSTNSILLPIEVRVRWAGVTPSYGDRVSFQGVAERIPAPRNPGEFDYHQWLERHGIYTQFSLDLSEPGSVLEHGKGNPLMAWALASRNRMEAILATDLQGAPMELSAIKGITLGVTENAPEGFTDDFRFTGTMHLFAVSGLHVGMLAVMIWFILMAARMPRPLAIAIIIPVLFYYVAITGCKSGSVRSASMVSLLLCGSVLYRRSPSLNTLAAAALIQLAVDSNVLFSAGWQFSYSVVFAIVVVAPLLEQCLCSVYSPDPFIPPKLLTRWDRSRFSAWRYLAGLLAISTAAWMGSILPTVAYFHLVSLSAIGANLLAVPLAFAVLALGSLSLITGGISLWLAGAFNNTNWLVTKILLTVVQTSAVIPGGHWFVGAPPKPYPVVTILDLRGGSCTVLECDGDFALINAGRKQDAVRVVLPFLETRGVNSIASILITKGDAAHLGGLPEIAHEVSVKRLGLLDALPRSAVAKNILNLFEKNTVKLMPPVKWPLTQKCEAEIIPLPENGVAVLLRPGKIRILLLPHLTSEMATHLQSVFSPEQLHADALITPLGGTDLASTLALFRFIAPKAVISSVESFNRNGIPSGEWKELLVREGISLLRQDETGAVIVEADALHPTIKTFLNPDKKIFLNESTSH